MPTPSQFAPMLDNLYAQLLACLPPEVRPPDCRLPLKNRCPAVMNCAPLNGFIDETGNCMSGLFFVTGNIVRLSEGDDDCISTWGLEVDVYLFTQCLPNAPCGSDVGYGPGLQLQLACCVRDLDVTIAWTGTPAAFTCARVIMDPVIECVREGLCSGAKLRMTVPIL